MIASIFGLVRLVSIIALRAACLFGVGLLIGFSGYSASAAGPHLSALIPGRSVEQSQAQSPHLVAYSAGVIQVRLH